MFCQGVEEALAGHTRNQCPIFRSLKQNTSAGPYVSATLRTQDQQGFAAAGIFPWRRTPGGGVELLLAREYRSHNRDRGGDKLNFLGGKRLKKETDALTCAVEKVCAETGTQLAPATVARMRDGSSCSLMCWSSKSKYVLFFFELVSEDDCEIDVRCAGIESAGVKRLEWIKRGQLMTASWIREEMHSFAGEMLEEVISCNALAHLEDLFDTAHEVPAPPSYASARGGMTTQDFFLHYDIVAAIRATLTVARPDSIALGNSPHVRELRTAIALIPQRDLRKIQLRIHPDRLVRTLHRTPDVLEEEAAKIAMQTLNALKDDTGGSEKDVVGNLKKWNELKKQADGASSSSDKVEALLSKLSMG